FFLPLLLFSFLSSPLGAHLASHSFPTRRSSDLARLDARPDRCHTILHRTPRRRPHRLDDRQRGRDDRLDYVDRASDHRLDDVPRSEEHTSELQSRENLVCRLLLEKKKKKTKEIT